MKFKCLPLSVFWHSMVCSNYSKRCSIVTFNSHAQTEPIVGDLPSFLPGQRAGKGACDVTGRDPSPNLSIIRYNYLDQINSIYPKNIDFKQIFKNYYNGNLLSGFLILCL